MFNNTSQAVAGGGTGVGRLDFQGAPPSSGNASLVSVSNPNPNFNANPTPSGPMSTPGNYMNSSGQMVVNGVVQGSSGGVGNQMMVTAGGKSVPSYIVGGQQVVVGENGLMQSATDWVKQNTEGSGFSFGGLFDNIAEKAMQNPMQAVSVGSALVTAFAESPQEKAAREYADQIARVRAQTDPNSDFGQTFMDTYTQQRQDELDKAYASAKAEWVNSMAKRGLTDSTVASEGLASLDAKFAELQSKLPTDAMNALQQYQNNQFKNLNAGLAPAATQAKLMASQSNPFSMASQGAVSSVGS